MIHEGNPASDASESELDALFDRALDRAQRGEDPLHESEEAAGDPDELAKIACLARQLCPPRPWGPPRVPGYRILRELGRGGMGVVWLARQERAAGRLVALKTVPGGMLARGAALDRFRREASALARTRHPNVVVLHDTIETESVLAFAMEWVGGPTLAELLRAGPTSDEEPWQVRVCRIGIAIGKALGHLADGGIVHRDVKPSNVLLRTDGTPLLSDLGLASLGESRSQTRTGTFLGTVGYASPEQLRGSLDEVDAQSDVYSLGATLFHALAGGPPVRAANALEALATIERRGPLARAAFPPDLSADLCAVLAKAMEPARERRYSDGSELAEDLERVLALRPARARTATRWRRLSYAARRNRHSLAAAALAMAITSTLVAVGALWLLVRPRYVDEQGMLARRLLLNRDFVPIDMQQRVAEETQGGSMLDLPVLRDASVRERYLRAGAHYDRALRWSDRADLREEREALGLVLDVLAGGTPPPGADLSTELARQWARDPHGVRIAQERVARAEGSQRRAAGLVAYLLDDPRTCLRLWSTLTARIGEEPFFDAAYGSVLLQEGRADWALPRLLAARRGFPDDGQLLAYAADAAFLIGDVDQARLLLDSIEDVADDRFEHAELLEADLLAAQGSWSEASARYARCSRRHTNPRSRLHGAVASLLSGEERIALWHAVSLPRLPRPTELRIAQAKWLADRWWASLRPGRRIDWIVSSWSDPPGRADCLGGAVRLAVAEEPVPVRVPDPELGTLPPFFAEAWLAELDEALPSARTAPPLHGLVWTRLLLERSTAEPLAEQAHRLVAWILLGLDASMWRMGLTRGTSPRPCPLLPARLR